MNHTKKIIASAVLLATSSLAFAASDSTSITINVTKDAYVNFIGTVDTNTTKALTLAQVDGVSTAIGDLGLESNTTGGCDVAFSSANTFKLLHDTSPGVYLHGAAEYSLGWDGATINSGALTVSLGSCDKAVADLDFNAPALPGGVVTAGIYSDTITMTVTTQ